METINEMYFCDGQTFHVGDRVMINISNMSREDANYNPEYPYAVPGTIKEIVVPKRGPILIKVLPDDVASLSFPDAWPLNHPELYDGKANFCEWRDHGKTAGNIRAKI